MKKIITFLIAILLIPSISYGAFRVITVPQGGTGAGSFTQDAFIVGNGTNALQASSTPFFSNLSFANASGTAMTLAGNLWTALTQNSVPFIGTDGLLTEDTDFVYNGGKLGIGTSSPSFTGINVDTGDIWLHDGSINVDYLANNGASNTANKVIVLARVNEVGGVTAGQAVYQLGNTGDKPNVSLASTNAHFEAHALGIATETTANGELVIVQTSGPLEDIDTSAYTDTPCLLHLTTTPGEMSCSHDTEGPHIHLGEVTKVNVSSGIIQVTVGEFIHDIQPTPDIDVEIGVGSDDDTRHITFNNLSKTIFAWFNGLGEFMIGQSSSTPSSNSMFTVSSSTYSGNMILVEDNGDGDTSPFVIDASGKVGIGTTSPFRNLDVNGDTYSDNYFGDLGAGIVKDSGTLDEIFTNTKEPTGFVSGTDSTISFTDGTRTFTISPAVSEFSFYSKGVKFTKTTAQTVVIDDTEGIWYIYFNSSGVLTASQVEWGFTDGTVQTSLVYWDATNNKGILIGDERHGLIMDGATHLNLHKTRGTQWFSGFTPSLTVDGNGSLDAHCEMQSISAGVLKDEDIDHSSAEQTSYEIWYKDGANGYWRKTTASDALVAITTTRPDYNQFTGGAWQRTEIANNKFTLSHIFATNDKDKTSIIIMGENEYNSSINARAGAITELNDIQLAGLPSEEFKPIATVIIQVADAYTNSYNARVISTADGSDFIDWRESENTGTGGTTGDHGNLAGLADDDHTQYLLADGSRALTANWDAGGFNITDVSTLTASILNATSTTATSTFAGGLTVDTDTLVVDYSTDKVGIGTDSPSASLMIENTGADNSFRVNDEANDTSPLIIDASGKLGIGTENPDVQIHVHEPTSGSAYIKFTNSTSGQGGTDGALFGLSGGENLDFWLYENDFMRFSTNNAERMRIDKDGNVGIGTSSPYTKLSVVGETVSEYFTATSTTASSTMPQLETTTLNVATAIEIAGEYISNFTTYVRSLFTGGNSITITDGSIAVDDDFLLNTGDTGTGTYDFSGATLKQHWYPAFTYATSTAWVGTTTIPLGPAYVAEQWDGVKCFTDTGTVDVIFNDGTNDMDTLSASTTVGTFALTTNNTFTASEKRYVDVGNPASSPTKISCTVDKIINN